MIDKLFLQAAYEANTEIFMHPSTAKTYCDRLIMRPNRLNPQMIELEFSKDEWTYGKVQTVFSNNDEFIRRAQGQVEGVAAICHLHANEGDIQAIVTPKINIFLARKYSGQTMLEIVAIKDLACWTNWL